MTRLIKILSLALVSFLATIAVDHAVGLFSTLPQINPGLIFRPHSEASYQTTEFSFTASINELGFRDREFSLAKPVDYRVIAIGDSFTYGWGVGLEQSWPKVLEQNLRNTGLRVEIANLGFPGGSPVTYAERVEPGSVRSLT